MAEICKPVIFRLNGQRYGIDISIVSSIEKELSVIPVPNSVPDVKGIINLRNEVVPVLSLKRKFNMPDDARCEDMIITKLGDMTIAIEVDGVEEIKNIDEAQVTEMPKIIVSDQLNYFKQVVNLDGELIVLIDVLYLLSKDEQAALEKMKDDLD